MISKFCRWIKCKFCCYSKCELEDPKYKEGSIIPKKRYNYYSKKKSYSV